jgi:catechol 2,3-dioxygenase-like lactoylglutathione lyase family enzyme
MQSRRRWLLGRDRMLQFSFSAGSRPSTLGDMNDSEIKCIAPLFIVRNVPAALAFYRDRLGFQVTFQGPEADDIFFGIVERGGAMIMMKAIGVEPVPNCTRDVKQGIARWDAYLCVPDPDALAAEFESRGVEFFLPLQDNSDGLRGFEVRDADEYVLYFGRPRNDSLSG